MKSKKFGTKLSLAKRTIANLSNREMSGVHAGADVAISADCPETFSCQCVSFADSCACKTEGCPIIIITIIEEPEPLPIKTVIEI